MLSLHFIHSLTVTKSAFLKFLSKTTHTDLHLYLQDHSSSFYNDDDDEYATGIASQFSIQWFIQIFKLIVTDLICFGLNFYRYLTRDRQNKNGKWWCCKLRWCDERIENKRKKGVVFNKFSYSNYLSLFYRFEKHFVVFNHLFDWINLTKVKKLHFFHHKDNWWLSVVRKKIETTKRICVCVWKKNCTVWKERKTEWRIEKKVREKQTVIFYQANQSSHLLFRKHFEKKHWRKKHW